MDDHRQNDGKPSSPPRDGDRNRQRDSGGGSNRNRDRGNRDRGERNQGGGGDRHGRPPQPQQHRDNRGGRHPQSSRNDGRPRDSRPDQSRDGRRDAPPGGGGGKGPHGRRDGRGGHGTHKKDTRKQNQGGGQNRGQSPRKPEIKRRPVKAWVETPPKRYGLVVYETFAAARNDLEQLSAKKGQFDQLNIVVRQEGNMDDPELTKFGKVFAGAAWALIHERRQQDGWYDQPR